MKHLLFFIAFAPVVLFAQDKVGIGTDTPQAKLDISAQGNGVGILRLSTERPWVFKQRYNGADTRLTLQPTSNLKRFEILSNDGSNRAAEFLLMDAASRVLLVPEGGQVGIGMTTPTAILDIAGTGDGTRLLKLSTERPWVFKQRFSGVDSRLTLQPTTNLKRFEILSNDGSNRAVEFLLIDAGSTVSLVPEAGRVGVGTTTPSNKLQILGNSNSSENVLSVSTSYLGNTNIRAIEGLAHPATGYGIGGFFDGGGRGIVAVAHGTSTTGWAIAAEASAYGTTGTRIGLFARAQGGSTNWAGYFAEGNVYMTNELRIGAAAINGAAGYKVAVAGKIIAEEVRVQLSGAWPDFVFENDYELMSLQGLEEAVRTKKHLPGIPSAKEIEENGLHLGDMQQKMMQKIEELTLYIIDVNKRLRVLESENIQLKTALKIQ